MRSISSMRGAISVTERTGYIARVRNLARICAAKYLEQREQLGFPLARKGGASRWGSAPRSGTEELPAHVVDLGTKQLKEKAAALLAEHRIGHGPMSA